MLDIKDIQALYNDMSVIPTQHLFYRIEKRGIKLSDIKFLVGNGEIIEQYPDDYPFPSALILGYTEAETPLHAVIGVGNGLAWLITAYYPDSVKWEADFKTRKVAE